MKFHEWLLKLENLGAAYSEAYEAHQKLMGNQHFLRWLVTIFFIALVAPLVLFKFFNLWIPLGAVLLAYFLAMLNERRKQRNNKSSN